MIELVVVDQIRKRFKEVKNESFYCLEFLIPENAIKCIQPTLTGVYNIFKFLKDVARLHPWNGGRRQLKNHVLSKMVSMMRNFGAIVFLKNQWLEN